MIKTKKTVAGARYWIYNPDAKETIVAIHGLRGTHHGLQFIAKALPQYKFIIPDLPGFGISTPLKKGLHDTKNYALWLDKFIDELALDKPPILLGHSFGSIIAGCYCSQHAGKISQLILINPIASHGNWFGSLVGKGYYQIGSLLPEGIGTKFLKSRLVTRVLTRTMLTTKHKHLKNRVYEQHFAYFGSFDNRRLVHQAFNATISDSVLNYTAKLTMPTLLIVGAKDRFAPLKGQKHLQTKLSNSQLKIIPNVGHLVHYETPEIATSYIANFLRNCGK